MKLALLVAALACGCTNTEEPAGGADASVPIAYEIFPATTWSVSHQRNTTQLSISDLTTGAACSASTNHDVQLAAPGSQVILNIDTGTAGPCAAGTFDVRTDCPASLGSDAFVPKGCAYYRRWDANGKLEGTLVARNGSIQIAGTASSCVIRANIGFLGQSLNESLTFDFTGAQPWCMD